MCICQIPSPGISCRIRPARIQLRQSTTEYASRMVRILHSNPHPTKGVRRFGPISIPIIIGAAYVMPSFITPVPPVPPSNAFKSPDRSMVFSVELGAGLHDMRGWFYWGGGGVIEVCEWGGEYEVADDAGSLVCNIPFFDFIGYFSPLAARHSAALAMYCMREREPGGWVFRYQVISSNLTCKNSSMVERTPFATRSSMFLGSESSKTIM